MVFIFQNKGVSSKEVKDGIKSFFNGLRNHHTDTKYYKRELVTKKPHEEVTIKAIPRFKTQNDETIDMYESERKVKLIEQKRVIYYKQKSSTHTQQDVYGNITKIETITYPEEVITEREYFENNHEPNTTKN